MEKVLFLTTISGFLPQFEMNDVSILQEAGYQIHYASNFNNPVYEVDHRLLQDRGIRTHHIQISKSPFHIKSNLKAFQELKRIIREEKITILHCHNPMGGVLGRFASLFRMSPMYVLYTAHGFHFYKGAPIQNWFLYYPVEWMLAKCTDYLITINKEDYERAHDFKLKKSGQIGRIPGVGINIERFQPQPGMREATRSNFKIKEDEFFILSVGELNANKNHKVIIQAIAKLKNKKIRYGICGRGNLAENLHKLAKELGVEKQVTLYGFRKDIPQMLAAADCFAFPSLREGLGIAALEAMAAGIPLITSDCRGTREYMVDNNTGIVCPKGSVQEYQNAIGTLYNNPKLRKSMSASCMEKAKQFDIKETDSIMRNIYSHIQKDRGVGNER